MLSPGYVVMCLLCLLKANRKRFQWQAEVKGKENLGKLLCSENGPGCTVRLPSIVSGKQETLNASSVIVVQSPGHVQHFSTPWTAAHQASLSLTSSQSLTVLWSIGFYFHHHCHNRESVLLWPSRFTLSGAVGSTPPLLPRSIWTPPNLGDTSFSCHTIVSFYTVHQVLSASILGWFAISSSSGSHFLRTLRCDPSILGSLNTAWLIVSLTDPSPLPGQGSNPWRSKTSLLFTGKCWMNPSFSILVCTKLGSQAEKTRDKPMELLHGASPSMW